MPARVEISHLCKSFGPLRAVDDVSFTVEAGEVLGFLGPNGAGKSTTMKMVTGFLAPTSGTAVVCGHDVLEAPLEVKRSIGYLPEGAPAYGEMTPRGFLEFCASVRGLSGQRARSAVERAVELTQLQGVTRQRIETLSKGYKRRVGIAQAILHDPEVLILDEPTDGLDPNQKFEVRALIQEMGKDKVIILSTHILEEVDAVCSRAIIIANGQLKADGTPEQLHDHAWGGRALRVGVLGAQQGDVSPVLAGLPGVERVEFLGGSDHATPVAGAPAAGAGVAAPTASANGLLVFRVWPSGGQDIRAEVGRCLQQSSWTLAELSQEQSGLDRVFREITTSGGASDAATASAAGEASR